MPRLHTLYLPGNGEGMPFAFILDQANPMSVPARNAWESFAEKCGARAITFTAETIDIDPEPADEPIDYYTTDHSGCDHAPPPGLMRSLIETIVKAGNAEAWVPWEPANLDPESPQVMTHREEACPASNDGVTGCPMHDPILEGGWVTWPYFATPQGIISRICDHGITHPTPEEYLGGFDTPHLCDGCPCAPVPDFSIVVSDLANTKLPRGTLLLGTKDDPRQAASRIAPEWADRLAKQPRDTSGRWAPDDPTPVTAPPAPAAAEVTPTEWFSAPITHEGKTVGNAELHPDGRMRGTLGANIPGETLAEALAKGPLSGDWGSPSMPVMDAIRANIEDVSRQRGIRIQSLGADGEPVGEAKDYPLAGSARVKKIPTEQGEPVEKWTTAEVSFADCGAGTLGAPCVLAKGHEGLHEFGGPFTRV